MKIAVIGPGAIGCLFGARLAEAGFDVSLVDHRADRAKRIKKNGVEIQDARGSRTVAVDCQTAIPKDAALQILAVKSHSTRDVRPVDQIPTLSIQNGLGNIEALCAMIGSSQVIAGTTGEAATLLGEGKIRHAAAGLTRIGAWTSCKVEPARDALAKAGFDVEITDAPGQILWEKVALSAAINPLTALLDVPNGQLTEIPEVRALMRDLVVEAVKVSATEGYRFEHSLVESAEALCRQTKDNISSMLQDVRARRPTEIDAISGEILRRAQNAALPCPRTRVVYQLVKGLEQR